MNLIQLRFSAAETSNQRLLTALKAGFSAYRHLNAQYVIRLVNEDGWFLDVFIGGSPFSPDQELITATLLRQGIAFDISFSPVGVDGEAVDVMYGLRRPNDAAIVWHDQAQSLAQGCAMGDLDPATLDQVGIQISIEHRGSETFLFSPEYVSQMEDRSLGVISSLALNTTTDAILRETARYLLRTRHQAELSA